jgi:undecaprenyl-phosphate 4-deoxy-4-formamido-L-arabinose transferase
MRKLATRNQQITAIKLCKNYGQQCAVLTGLKYTNSDFTVIIDDDLQQQPKDIIKLYQEIVKGYDVVYGVNKTAYQKKVIRQFGSRLRDYVFNRITNKPKDIKVCSFRMLNRKTVEQVVQSNNRFVYISMEILKHTRNIGNIKVDYASNNHSNYNLGKLIRLIIKLYITYSPQKMFEPFKQYGNDCEQYEIINKEQKLKYHIKEDNAWVKVMDHILGEIPILNFFTGYFFNPSYRVIDLQNKPILKMKKEASFFGRKFQVTNLNSTTIEDEESIILSLMMMVLIERRKG